MRELVEISAQNLYNAVYETCYCANIYMSLDVYNALKNLEQQGTEPKSKMNCIFANANIAAKNKRPLCQDTGQVIVFLEIGEDVVLDSKNPKEIVNKAVADCYKENCFRKSVVKNALFGRENTLDNTPVIIYTDYVQGDKITVDVLIKGAGSENMSAVKMFNPSASKEDIFDFVVQTVNNAGENACPPMFLGVGVGGTMDYACVLSKKAYFKNDDNEFSAELKDYVDDKTAVSVADVRVLSAQTHIACLPVSVTVNCHSTRHAGAVVSKDGYKIVTECAPQEEPQELSVAAKEFQTTACDVLRTLNAGDEILLSGTVYTARDAAHKKLAEMIKNGEELPFELKNSIIFYAGPCPKKDDEIIGPIGPTTAKRMDLFAPMLYDMGVLATIGKGERADEVKQSVQKNNAIYFSVQGGVASLLQSCVKSAEVVAFEDLGAEAIYKLEVEKLPLKVELI